MLEGLGTLLDGVKAVELETHFRELYKGEGLFSDVQTFMERKGFTSRHLEPQGLFGGELVEANAFWVRRDGLEITGGPDVLMWEALNRLPGRVSYAGSAHRWPRPHGRG